MAEDDQQKQQPEKKPVKGYGKRPLWQWFLIYLVIAIVLYGLIYLLFFNNGGDNSSNGLGY